MRRLRSPVRTCAARSACLSTRDQVTYSFCRTLEPFHSLIEPWHRLEAQFTTPRCMPFAS